MAKTRKQETGTWGEQLACELLVSKGFRIIDQNWRHGHSEIDIVAQVEQLLVFVEVKVRKNSCFGFPEEFVSKNQAARVKTAAEKYQLEKNFHGFIRFDIVSVLGHPTNFEVLHLEDAF